jgi:predicted dehydrogenase
VNGEAAAALAAVQHSQRGGFCRGDHWRQAIDAVLICSPTGTHADLIVQAAQAGKHIFCEKPIAFSLKTN